MEDYQSEIAEYMQEWNTLEEARFLFANKIISTIKPKTVQKLVENNQKIRETSHHTYQKIEDALEPNCINRVGDLYEDKQVRANILMNAAKAAKKQGIKFDPSPYLPNYECYNKDRHGNPVLYLKKHFGEFLASCNEEKTDYLFRGDIPVIDPQLRGALYRNHRKEFEELTFIAGKKSQNEVKNMSNRGKNKFKKIISLDMSAKQ